MIFQGKIKAECEINGSFLDLSVLRSLRAYMCHAEVVDIPLAWTLSDAWSYLEKNEIILYSNNHKLNIMTGFVLVGMVRYLYKSISKCFHLLANQLSFRYGKYNIVSIAVTVTWCWIQNKWLAMHKIVFIQHKGWLMLYAVQVRSDSYNKDVWYCSRLQYELSARS